VPVSRGHKRSDQARGGRASKQFGRLALSACAQRHRGRGRTSHETFASTVFAPRGGRGRAAGRLARRFRARLPDASGAHHGRFPPGAATDIVARLVAQALSERLGQQFIVENKPDAASNLAAETVARATPDGYTLLAMTVTNAVNTTLYEKTADLVS